MEKHHAFWWAIIVVAGLFTGLYGIELWELSQGTQLQLSSAGDSLTGFAVSDGVTGFTFTGQATTELPEIVELVGEQVSQVKFTSKKINVWNPSAGLFKAGENILLAGVQHGKSGSGVKLVISVYNYDEYQQAVETKGPFNELWKGEFELAVGQPVIVPLSAGEEVAVYMSNPIYDSRLKKTGSFILNAQRVVPIDLSDTLSHQIGGVSSGQMIYLQWGTITEKASVLLVPVLDDKGNLLFSYLTQPPAGVEKKGGFTKSGSFDKQVDDPLGTTNLKAVLSWIAEKEGDKFGITFWLYNSNGKPELVEETTLGTAIVPDILVSAVPVIPAKSGGIGVTPKPMGTAACPAPLSNYDVNKDGAVDKLDMQALATFDTKLAGKAGVCPVCPIQSVAGGAGTVAPEISTEEETEEATLPECTANKQYELLSTGNLQSICIVDSAGKSYWKACVTNGDVYGSYLCVNGKWQSLSGIGNILESVPKPAETIEAPTQGVCTLGEKGTGANAAKVCDGTKFVVCDYLQHQKAYGKYYCNKNLKGVWAECGTSKYKEGYVVASKKYICIKSTNGVFSWQDITGMGNILESVPKPAETIEAPTQGVCTLGEKGTGANAAKVCDGTKFVVCDYLQHQKAYGKYYCNKIFKGVWAECGAGNYKEGYVTASKKYVCIKSTKGTFSWQDISGIGKVLKSAPKIEGTATTATTCKTESDCKKNADCKGKLIENKYCVWSMADGKQISKRKALCTTHPNWCVDGNGECHAGGELSNNKKYVCEVDIGSGQNDWKNCTTKDQMYGPKYICDGTTWKVTIPATTLSSSSIVKVDLGTDVTKGWLHIGDNTINYFKDTVPTASSKVNLKFALPYTIGKNEILLQVNDVDHIGSLIKMDGNAVLLQTPGTNTLGLQTNINIGNAKNKDGVAKFVFAGDKKEHTLSFDLPGNDDLEIKDLYARTGIISEESIFFGYSGNMVGAEKQEFTYTFDSSLIPKNGDDVRLRFWVMGMDPEIETKVWFNNEEIGKLNEELNNTLEKDSSGNLVSYTEMTDLSYKCKERQLLKNYNPVTFDISAIDSLIETKKSLLGNGVNSIKVKTTKKDGDEFFIGRVEILVNPPVPDGLYYGKQEDLLILDPADHTGKFIAISGGGC